MVAGYGLQYWSAGHRVPDEHRRPAAPQLAGLHHPDLRDDDPVRRRSPPCWACWRLNGLPEPYHPVFNVPALRARHRATGSSSCIEARDPQVRPGEDARVPARAWPGVTEVSEVRALSAGARSLRVLASPGGRWRSPAAARTCTTSRGTSRTGESDFFGDRRSARPLVEGTVARGSCARTRISTRASVDGAARGHLPVPGHRGARCSAAASGTASTARPATAWPGNGDGMVVARGYRKPSSFHVDRLRARAGRLLLRRDHERLRGHARLRRADPVEDRWAIVGLRARLAAQPERDGWRTCPADAARASSARAAGPRRRRPGDITDAPTCSAPAVRGPAPARRARRRRARASSCARSAGFTNAGQFYRSWLFAFLFWIGIALGCLSITLIHNLTGGMWGLVIRRLLEAGARTLPWSRAAVPARRVRAARTSTSGRSRRRWPKDALLQYKAALPERALLPGARRLLLRRLVRARPLPDASGRASWTRGATTCKSSRRLRSLGGAGLLLMGLTITFSSVDWGDVAQPALVLDRLRRAVHGRPGALRDGASCIVCLARAGRRAAALARAGARNRSTTWAS